jgi:undecaprenyl-diphosphatase
VSFVRGWRRPYLLAGGGGLVVLAISARIARNGEVGSTERDVFHAVNDLPDWLYRPLWVFQQFGNLLVAAVIGAVVLVALRKYRLALAVPVGVALKLLGERAVKQVIERARPESTVGDVHLRGNVPTHGLSFVSGHAVIAATIAMLLTAALPRRWRPVPWIVAGLNSFVRVYVGAHNPLDVIGGLGLGILIGAVLVVIVHQPADSSA